MRLDGFEERRVDWAALDAVSIAGADAASTARTCDLGDCKIRLIEFHAGYLADHWCAKGHILFLVDGQLEIEHEDGRPSLTIGAGMSWCAPDGGPTGHRVRSVRGAKAFVVD